VDVDPGSHGLTQPHPPLKPSRAARYIADSMSWCLSSRLARKRIATVFTADIVDSIVPMSGIVGQ
jgi:hypothetical protein